MKISFITTVLNEEKTIGRLLDSLWKQTRMPDEIIIVDGGSRDNTISNVKFQISNVKWGKTYIKTIIKPGNRAVGRNEAVRQAKGEIILCADAGCILKEDWVERMVEGVGEKVSKVSEVSKVSKGAEAAIVKPHPSPLLSGEGEKKRNIDVVAGYYEGRGENIFQKCLIPYVLVMPDKVDPDNFLPATRSMAFTKAIWKRAGGFPEAYSHNEDYVFARKLKDIGAHIVFQKKAIVYWLPRNTLRSTFWMFARFAYGDAESGIMRPKVIVLFLRYFAAVCFVLAAFKLNNAWMISLALVCACLYLLWSIQKNYRYVRDIRAFFYLPLLQLIADMAVMGGSAVGFGRRIMKNT